MSEPADFVITTELTPDGVTVVSLRGQIMTGGARRLGSFLKSLRSGDVKDIIIDMSAVTYACSAVLAFFVSACGGYTAEGTKFNAAFCGVPANILASIESLGLTHLLRIAPTRAAAEKLLSGGPPK